MPNQQSPACAMEGRATPLWAYLLVLLAICSMSWGGVLFGLMADTPVGMRVAWRLYIATEIQIFGFIRDWRAADASLRARWRRELPTLVLNGFILALHFWMFAASIEYTSFANSMLLVSIVPAIFVVQGLAFWAAGAWLRRSLGPAAIGSAVDASGGVSPVPDGDSVASRAASASQGGVMGAPAVRRRSRGVSCSPGEGQPPVLPSASATDGAGASRDVDAGGGGGGSAPARAGSSRPIGVRALAWLRGGSDDPAAPLPPTALEISGASVAMVGMVILILLTAGEKAAAAGSLIRSASPYGDGCALVAALCMAAYLAIGRSLRGWMPLWLYVTPVTGIAAVVAACASLLIEPGTSITGNDAAALFGWGFDTRRMIIAVAAGVVPTILGHSMANMSLRYVHPLAVSVMQLLQTIIGGFYGYFLGVAAVPSPVTLGAGPLILIGVLLTVTGGRNSPCPPHTWLPSIAACCSSGGSGGGGRRRLGEGDEEAGGEGGSKAPALRAVDSSSALNASVDSSVSAGGDWADSASVGSHASVGRLSERHGVLFSAAPAESLWHQERDDVALATAGGRVLPMSAAPHTR